MSDKSIAIIANGRHTKTLKSIETEIEDKNKKSDFSIKLFKSNKELSIRTLASKAAAKYAFLIAVGGDGTIHDVLNGIYDAHKEDYCTLGFIPTGSANDFNKTMKGANSLNAIITKITNKKVQKITVGKIDFQKNVQERDTRYFINIASLGMGYNVMKIVNHSTKKLGANLSYFSGIFKTFFTYKNIPISCKTNDWHWQGKIKSLAVANGKYFGSGLCIAPHANPQSDSLAITIVGNVSLWAYLLKLIPLKMGKFLKHSQVHYHKAKKIEVTSQLPCGIEADGEVLGTTPINISILPKKIKVLN